MSGPTGAARRSSGTRCSARSCCPSRTCTSTPPPGRCSPSSPRSPAAPRPTRSACWPAGPPTTSGTRTRQQEPATGHLTPGRCVIYAFWCRQTVPMTVPMVGRWAAAAGGGLLVVIVWASVIETLIVARPVRNWLTRRVNGLVNAGFRVVTSRLGDYRRRDRVLVGQAAAILLAQLAAWLGVAFVGCWLLLWPVERDWVAAFSAAVSSLFTLGYAEPTGAAPAAIVFAAAATGLVIVTLQIAYLPTLYGAFNRRETEVALLDARAGVPSWGPELLARTHYALGSGVSTLDTLPGLYAQWERWAADVAESHTAYLPLVWFRSPRPLSSWVTGLLAVLDSSALFLALSPTSAPVVPARLRLRSGFLCFNQIARVMGDTIPEEAEQAD